MSLTLRGYQARGRDDIRAEYQRGRRRVLYVLPTGGGKTVLYAAIAQGASAKGNRVLILEHRKELIRQASVALARIGIGHRVIVPKAKLAGVRDAHVAAVGWPTIDPAATVAVASVQTVGTERGMAWLAEFDPDLIVIDEAHHAVAGAWDKVIKACPRARLLGVTATPCRTNGQGLGDVFDSMVLGPPPSWMIDNGWLVPPRIIVPPLLADLSDIRRRGGDLDPEALADALDKRQITGDAIEHYARIAPGKPAIVFASTLKHAEHVAEQFREAGWRFEVIHGGLDDGRRDHLIGALASGEIHGLVSKDLISEGTDIPVAEVAIFLRDSESETFFLQACGRVLRPVFADGFDLSSADGRLASIAASDKPHGIIIDHVGIVGKVVDGMFVPKHGRPDDDREWALEGRRKRKKAGPADDVPADLQCPSCYAITPPAPACQSCGADLSALAQLAAEKRRRAHAEMVEGQLIELQREAAKVDMRRAQGAAQTVQDMVAATGMDPKRAAHILAAREEKARLRTQLVDLAQRWYQATGRGEVPLQRALRDAFGWSIADIRDMKPKALRAGVEAVTNEVLRLEFGEPASGGGLSIRPARRA